MSLTLDDVANDGEAANPENEDPGDPNNNYGSDLDNVHFYDDYCDNWQTGGGATTPVTIVGDLRAEPAVRRPTVTTTSQAAPAPTTSAAATAPTRSTPATATRTTSTATTASTPRSSTSSTRCHNCENVDLANVPSAFDTCEAAALASGASGRPGGQQPAG